jgi:hypothetical protein
MVEGGCSEGQEGSLGQQSPFQDKELQPGAARVGAVCWLAGAIK